MSKLTSSNKFLFYVWLPLMMIGIISFNVIYPIMATEFRPAGSGGGDAADGTVTSDGNNVFSGNNTFQSLLTVSNGTPLFEIQDTTAGQDDFLFQANTSQFDIVNEQDTVTYLSFDANHQVTLGSSSGGTILNGANGAVSVANATPIFELQDTTGAEDDFLLRAQTSALTLENETDAVTYMTVASTHNMTLGSSSGTTTLESSGSVTANAIVTSNVAAPIFELQDTTGGDDDFLMSVDASAFSLVNETDVVTYLAVNSSHGITLGSTSGTTTLTSSASVTASVPVTVEAAVPTFELQDSTGAQDDFLLQANTSQFDLLNETDAVTYFSADANHKVTVGSSSGGTVLNGSNGAVSVENATPIFELQDTTGAEDDFLLRAQTSAFTLENETDAVTYMSIASTHNMTLGSSSGATTLTSSSSVTANVPVTVESAVPVFELQDSTGSEDDFLLRAEGSTLDLRNEQDQISYLAINSNNDIQVGNSSDSGVVVTADAGGIMMGAAQYPRVVTMADGATIAWDASKGNFFRVTLAGNRTINGGSNGRDGQRVIFHVIQDGTGTRTLTFASGTSHFRFGSDTISSDCTLSTGASSSDYIASVFNSSVGLWDILSCSRGY